MERLFVTGTDTNVGKTELACALAAHYTRDGLRVAVRKPAESGCELINVKLFPVDANELKEAAGNREPLLIICPHRFSPVISPEAAALQTQQNLSLNDLYEACWADKNAHDLLIIEGAGGWLSPIAVNATNADLAIQLKAEIILVVKDILGCVNHTLLTLASIKSSGCKVRQIYLMSADKSHKTSYLNDLNRWVDLPIIQLPFVDEKKPWKSLLFS